MVMPFISSCQLSVASCRLFFFLSALLVFPAVSFAATLFCQISAFSPDERSFKVSCAVSDLPTTGKIELRFADRFAGIERLSERIYGVQIKDASGQRLLPEILGGGTYRVNPGNSSQLTLEYQLRLSEINGVSRDPSKYALTSSLSPQFGFLLLSDVLPELCSANQAACEALTARLKFQLPEGWELATTESQSFGAFDVVDVTRAVFFIGKLRRQSITVGQMKIHVALAGDTSLSDVQVNLLVEAIARQQATMMESREQGDFLVTLTPFPIPLTGMRSSALTRGRSIVMMLNPEADARRTLSLYQKHLAHEMFHFYLPEAFQPRENFDWFWEGSARYIALLTLNRLKFITLREYLDELSFEYETYAANPLRNQVSLIAASQGKFDNAASYDLVYRKGTLITALYDLELRTQSNSRKNLMDVLRELYANYRQRDIGNREVLATMRKAGKFETFIQDYIEGTTAVDLPKFVKPYGLQVESASGSPRLSVIKNPSLKQNTILAQFGH
jgi:predicted metalloprotease with PDZ domain